MSTTQAFKQTQKLLHNTLGSASHKTCHEGGGVDVSHAEHNISSFDQNSKIVILDHLENEIDNDAN